MRFIGFFEYEGGVQAKAVEKFRQMAAEREKTDRFGKIIFGPFNFSGQTKGFTVYEADDLDKLSNIAIFYMPEVKYKFIPIQESARAAELYVKMKK